MAFLNIPPEYSNRSAAEIAAQAGTGGLPLIPPGKYTGLFVTSEMKPTTTGGQMLVMKAVITQGDHRDTELTERLNLINNNPVAMKIAYETLAKIANAIGLTAIPTDSAALHNKPMTFVVKTEVGQPYKDKNTGETRQGKDYSTIAGYEPIPQVGISGVASVGAATAAVMPWDKKAV